MERLPNTRSKPYLRFSSTWISILLLIVILGTGCGRRTPALTVCDVLNDLSSYSDKLIDVSGDIYIGFEVFAVGQQDCEPGLVTLGHKWPSAIHAGVPTLQATWDAYPEEADRRSVEFMSALSNAFIRTYWTKDPIEEQPFKVSATLVGVLRTRELIRTDSNGRSVVEGGFGHLNTYPAELEVIAVRDIVLKQIPAPSVTEKPKPGK